MGSLAKLAGALGFICLAGPASAAVDVDLELVLAVDVSRSMDRDEQALQRNGYIAAFRHPEVIEAIRSGLTGRIAVTYMEWSGPAFQQVLVPWTVIGSARGGGGFCGVARAGADHARDGHVDLRRPRGGRPPVPIERRALHPPGHRRLRRRAQQHGPAGRADARFGDRAGDRHQRPADRAEDEQRLQPVQHSRSRRLLRGLRDRRSRRLHDHRRRHERLRQGDPPQAGAGDFRPDAAADAGGEPSGRRRGSIA